jgi:hypothetical protein
MKRTIITVVFISFSVFVFSQINEFGYEKKNSITIGFLQGGGSLIGADFEALISRQVGLQFGAGLIGFGGGINYHFKPSIRSSFLSFQYWHQGFGDSFTQSAIGPNFVFRGKKWLTFQIGFGATLDKGPAFPSRMEQPPVMLLYSIGAYIPI